MELYLKYVEAEKQYCRTLSEEDRRTACRLYAAVERDRATYRPKYTPWKEVKGHIRGTPRP